MGREHKGLDLAGIIIIYIFSSSLILAMLVSWSDWGYLEAIEVILLLLGLATLVLTILYHRNQVTNYILIGVLGIFVSIIGGIFILVDNNTAQKTVSNKPDDLSNLEYKLRQLDTLLSKGVITKEEFDLKRKSILEKFE